MAKDKRPREGTTLKDRGASYLAAVPDAPDQQALYIPLMESRLSGKNQITLPVRMTRALDWRPGDRLSLMLDRDMIVISRLPREGEGWDRLRVHDPEWSSKEAIEEWVRKEHESWDREWDPD
jgi:bifunctional DNA-binding transcriptional regulator/antitoxin component of YhaV-PrlF toxin-antitoxin module